MEWGCFLHSICETAPQSSFLSTYCVSNAPDVNVPACGVGTDSLLWSRQGSALDHQPWEWTESRWHKRGSLLHPLPFCSNKRWPAKPRGYFILRQILPVWKQKYFNRTFVSQDRQVLLGVLITSHNLLKQQVNPIRHCCSFVSYGNEAEMPTLPGWVRICMLSP